MNQGQGQRQPTALERYEKIRALAQTSMSTEQIALVKQQVAKKATDAELALFLTVAKNSRLDPFRKQIYAIHRRDKRCTCGGSEHQRDADGYCLVMGIQTGIDGYRAQAERTGEHAGTDDVIYQWDGGKYPVSASVTVYRLKGGVRCPFTATVFWDEYMQGWNGKPTGMWASRPKGQLGKCAEAAALRKGFPGEVGAGGVYVDAELDHLDNDEIPEVEAEVVEAKQEGPDAGTVEDVEADWA